MSPRVRVFGPIKTPVLAKIFSLIADFSDSRTTLVVLSTKTFVAKSFVLATKERRTSYAPMLKSFVAAKKSFVLAKNLRIC